MSLRSEILSVLCLFLAITIAAAAQMPSSRPAGVATANSNIPSHGTGGGTHVALSVVDDKMGRLDRQALVRLYDENIKTNNWQPTSKNSVADFDDVGLGKYDVEVSAVGYLTARKEIEISNTREPVRMQVILLRDPDAAELTGTDPTLPEKASKEAERGISDLLSRKYKDAQKHLESALKQAPSSSYVNFLLGYLYFQQNDFDQAQTYLSKATTLDAHNIQALNLSGRVQLARRDFAGAKTTLEQAIAVAPENATAHGLLADAYLNLGDYKNALAQSDLAIEKGASGVSSARIVRGQSLANLGRDDDAIATLKTYLQNAPDSASGPQVRQLIAMLEARQPNAPPAAKP
jgi:tetratricopeptide (TPR) repeat protein